MDLAETFENVQITVVGFWAMYCGFHGYIAHARRCLCEGKDSGPTVTITTFYPTLSGPCFY